MDGNYGLSSVSICENFDILTPIHEFNFENVLEILPKMSKILEFSWKIDKFFAKIVFKRQNLGVNHEILRNPIYDWKALALRL